MTQNIETILARAAGFGVSAVRDVQIADPDEALGFIFDWIEGCMLPRTLVVSADQATKLSIDVSGGRVLSVRAGDGAILGEGFDSSDPEHADACVQILRKHLAGCSQMSVDMRAPDAILDPAQTGVDVAALLEASALFRVPAAERVQDMMIAMQDVIFAICREGKAPDILADDVQLAPEVLDLVSEELSDPKGLQTILSAEDLLIVDIDDLLALGLLQSQEGPLGLLFERAATADVCRFWATLPQSVVAGVVE